MKGTSSDEPVARRSEALGSAPQAGDHAGPVDAATANGDLRDASDKGAERPSDPGGSSVVAAPGAPDETRLVWVDMEMTGLRPEIDRIIEVAVVVTDSELRVLAEGPVLVIHQPERVLAGMDAWNQATHGRTGLTERV